MSPSPNPTSARRRPTTAKGSPLGAVGSVLLHAGMVAAMLFTFRHNFEPPEETHSVPVDLVTIAEKTNVAAMAPPQPTPPPKITPPVEEMTPPPLPQFADAEPAPDVEPPKFKIQDEPKPTPPKPAQQDFAALLNKLAAPQKTQKNVKAGPRVIQGIGAANAMTADLVDFFRNKMKVCWHLQGGAPNPADQIVNFDVHLNPDGSVGGLQLKTLSAGSNPYTRAAAEAASRAIYECQPYKLPQNRYNDWRDLSMNFDPREMMEQ